MENTVVAVYDHLSEAQDAQRELLAAGFSSSDIRLSSEAERSGVTTDTEPAHESHGIGHFFRSLFGTEDASREGYHGMYSEAVRRGSYVLAVDTATDDLHERAVDIMNRFNPVDIDERASQWSSQGWSGYDASAPRLTEDEIRDDRSRYTSGTASSALSDSLTPSTDTTESTRIPVVEEELKVGKREVSRGGVRVYQRVKETPVHESVDLREEHVKVERHPVDKPATEADLAAFKEGTVELRESAEEAVVDKTARVVEEVVIGKEATTRTEEINDTVRRTDVDVEQLNPGAMRTGMDTTRTGMMDTSTTGMGMGTSAMDDDADYRRHWQSTYGQTGGRYEDYDAAYRYGSSLGGTDRYRNYRWEEVEPDLRTNWEAQHPGSAWDKMKDAVRYGIDRMSGHSHTAMDTGMSTSTTGMGTTRTGMDTSTTGMDTTRTGMDATTTGMDMARTGMDASTTGMDTTRTGMMDTSTTGMGMGTSAMDTDTDTDYRRHWQNAYGQTGGRYEDYDAAYRYGSSLGGTDRYRNYRWEEVEPDLRTNWEAQHPESAWDKVKDAVRYGIDRMSGHSPHH